MHRIGEFSRVSQVAVKTLRFYDEIGLLRPAHIERRTGYRWYDGGQLERINQILAAGSAAFHARPPTRRGPIRS